MIAAAKPCSRRVVVFGVVPELVLGRNRLGEAKVNQVDDMAPLLHAGCEIAGLNVVMDESLFVNVSKAADCLICYQVARLDGE